MMSSIGYDRFRLKPFMLVLGLAVLVVGVVSSAAPAEAYELSNFSDKFTLEEIVPGADRLGPEEGSPPAAIAYKGNKAVGYVFLNSAIVDATGYSGKPIHVVVGMDTSGTITGAKLVKHHEPIVLVGIPVAKIHAFINKYRGFNILSMVAAGGGSHEVDVVSGATVTVMIIDDTILRAAIKVARARGVGGLKAVSKITKTETVSIRSDLAAPLDWQTMLGEGSVRRMTLSVGEVTDAMRNAGKTEAAARPESSDPGDLFIDLYTASLAIPTVARSLLGDREFANLTKMLKPGESAILVSGRGLYSFKGSGYVRGGIFDRFQLIQGDVSVRFRDHSHKRLGRIEAEGAPEFTDVDLFVIPADKGFDPALPWRIELLVQRAIGPIKKEFITFDVSYLPPEKYLERRAAKPAATGPVTTQGEPADAAITATPLWEKIWLAKIPDIGVLVAGLGVLTLIFFFQLWFVVRPVLLDRIRIAFLIFTAGWIGFYEQAQLSIVNVLTFAGALITEFRWDFFLKEPLIFLLWGSVAASLLFWGRGVYCGWLCPFGALQELLNRLAKMAKIPQITIPWGLHERLWPIKYILFLGLFGLSLYSFETAEQFAEIEPFKTVVILKFAREWPYLIYAILLLMAGLFIERFFCRYICPLGGALGIPGRMRMNDWLYRYKECGSPCQRCAKECMVQAIHPEGHINPNECLQCLHCQTVYYDDHQCPPMIQKRLKRKRRKALASQSLKMPKAETATADKV